jgi:hypothetical protein
LICFWFLRFPRKRLPSAWAGGGIHAAPAPASETAETAGPAFRIPAGPPDGGAGSVWRRIRAGRCA